MATMYRRVSTIGIAIATVIGFFLVEIQYDGFVNRFFRQLDVRVHIETDDGDAGKSEVLLLAYYYAWYKEGDWSRFSTQGVFPEQGLYGSNRIPIAEQHNEYAVQAGIDAWVVSWRKENPGSNFRKGMLQTSNFEKMKYCLLYESQQALPTMDFADASALDAFVESLKVMRDNHFNHSSYLHVNGRPVVVLYTTRAWNNFQPYMVDIVKEKIGVDIFFIADEPWFGPQGDPLRAKHGIKDGEQVFDAYTTYNMYTHVDTKEGQTAVDYMLSPKVFNVLQEWSKSTVFFPNVLPKYHHFRPYGHALTGDAEGLRTQLDKFACLPRPADFDEGSIPNIMFVTSFNEWWEGSQIEPDDGSGGYDTTYIEELRDFKETGVKCKHRR